MSKAKIKDEVLGEFEFEAKGVLPVFNNNPSDNINSLANQLKSANIEVPPFKRIPVPVEIATYTRMSYICEKFNTSFAQLMSDLIRISLPGLEKELGIKELDVIEYFNNNKPKGYEDMTAISMAQLEKAFKGEVK